MSGGVSYSRCLSCGETKPASRFPNGYYCRSCREELEGRNSGRRIHGYLDHECGFSGLTLIGRVDERGRAEVTEDCPQCGGGIGGMTDVRPLGEADVDVAFERGGAPPGGDESPRSTEGGR